MLAHETVPVKYRGRSHMPSFPVPPRLEVLGVSLIMILLYVNCDILKWVDVFVPIKIVTCKVNTHLQVPFDNSFYSS